MLAMVQINYIRTASDVKDIIFRQLISISEKM